MIGRRWGIAAVRAKARLTLERLPLLHRGAAAASDRRAASWRRWAARQRASAVRERHGPRLAPFRHRDLHG